MAPNILRRRESWWRLLRAHPYAMHPDAALEIDVVGVAASGEHVHVMTEHRNAAREFRHIACGAARRTRWVVLCQETEGLAAARRHGRDERQKGLREIAKRLRP